MDESDRIVDEIYAMVMEQKSGCKCGVCLGMFEWEYHGLLNEIMNDMKTLNTGSVKQ